MIHPDDLPPEARAQLRPLDPAAEAERAETESRLTARLEELEARVPREQAGRLDPVENTRAIVDWVNENFGDLPGWQVQRLDEAFPKPPPPVELPRLVDDCNSATYDKARARLDHLETVRQRQADEIGRLIGRLDDRNQTIARIRDLASVLAERSPGVSQAHTFARKILAALDGDTPKEQA